MDTIYAKFNSDGFMITFYVEVASEFPAIDEFDDEMVAAQKTALRQQAIERRIGHFALTIAQFNDLLANPWRRKWNGSAVVDTPALAPATSPVDHPLKRWQFKAMVNLLGVAQAIEDAIATMPDPFERAVALARYHESDDYRRDDPLFDTLAPLVGLTSEQIDEAWMQIATG